MILGLLFIPESPRWLARNGRIGEFKASLQMLRGKANNIQLEAENIMDAIVNDQYAESMKLSLLLQRRYMQPLIIVMGVLSLQQLGGINALICYASEIFQTAGFSSANLASLSVAILQVVMAGVSGVLVDKSGRHMLLMVSSVGTAVSCFLVALSYYLREHSSSSTVVSWTGILCLTGLLVFISSYSLGFGPVPGIIMSEVIPANMKGLAGSLAVVVNCSCDWLVTLSFNSMLNWSAVGSFGIFTGISAFSGVFVAFFVPETKGKTLEEIQDMFQ